MFIHTTSAAYYGRSIKITSDILELEKHKSLEINSRWYELIADLASQKSCEQEWCHTIYILVTLLSHGLTGLSSWPAAISLGDYLMKRIHLLENKRIIELGAVSGLLGLTL
ncbi:unnamed protein product [Adineta steineri]|uniref:Uncharacterized protein n=1 Tax=Adineta steineri TaxID=433720 RepID=A0A819P3C9_9BILA|nr:unnamed protein product [Adineta steineri]CAF1388599.1 unnamed protein product [Adineta steineri]CAF1583644.1 unnamed protein product [Adineta steineri]CAF4002060.1 unnamed protein product [Adineta steineri]